MGYGAYHWPKLGVFVISLFTGSIFGTVLYTLFFSDVNAQRLDGQAMTIHEKIAAAGTL